uniref:Uncharacterized protein n=1 Tax=Parastrongyloides trichosuri TaxID=131310 RepID=A0A0N5A6F8_PARTI
MSNLYPIGPPTQQNQGPLIDGNGVTNQQQIQPQFSLTNNPSLYDNQQQSGMFNNNNGMSDVKGDGNPIGLHDDDSFNSDDNDDENFPTSSRNGRQNIDLNKQQQSLLSFGTNSVTTSTLQPFSSTNTTHSFNPNDLAMAAAASYHNPFSFYSNPQSGIPTGSYGFGAHDMNMMAAAANMGNCYQTL